MRIIFSCLLLACASLLSAHGHTDSIETQVIDKHFFCLEKEIDQTIFRSAPLNGTDTFTLKIDSIIRSTGNPKENIHLFFTDAQHGFIYGNEMGYGFWPFLFKTDDGGKHWERKLFKPYQGGTEINQDNFYMFDNKRGILIYNTDNRVKFVEGTKQYFKYYITDDGGDTWKKKKLKLKHAQGLRIENNHYFMHCSFTSKGEVTAKILRAPWASARGKREIKDRIRLIISSKDFGHHFAETIPK